MKRSREIVTPWYRNAQLIYNPLLNVMGYLRPLKSHLQQKRDAVKGG